MPPSRALEREPPVAEGPRASRRKAEALLFSAIVAATVAMMTLSFPAGVYTIFGGSLSNSTTPATVVRGLNLDVVLATVTIPVAGNMGDLFLVALAIYLGFFLLAARQGAGLFKALRKTASGNFEALFTNPLAATIVLVGASSFVTMLVDSIQTTAGISTGSLTGDPFLLLVDFTLAPLLEETTFRAIMIGLPVLVLAVVMFRGLSPSMAARALWRPSSLWDVDEDGGEARAYTFADSGPSIFPAGSGSLKVRAIKPVVLVFLVLSSFIFGYAHYASGGGWGVGKISEAALAGLALGYLYVKYGFAANVLFHWSVNYVGTVFSFLAQVVYGVSWTSNGGSPLDVIPTLVIVYVLGIPSAFIVATALLRRTRLAQRQVS